MKNKILILFLILGNILAYAQCTVNAGGNTTICGTTFTLDGGASAGATGTPTWSLVTKPSGATDPTISNINAYKPNVTGLNSPGNYIFQISQSCNDGSTVNSQVTITAPGDVSTFTAGTDITNVNATTGTVTLSDAVVPTGYTASWSAYNIYNWERFATKNMANAVFSSTTATNPDFSLIKKANHDADPAYVVTLKITSINNPSCVVMKKVLR
jgi:hypothetical protein